MTVDDFIRWLKINVPENIRDTIDINTIEIYEDMGREPEFEVTPDGVFIQ